MSFESVAVIVALVLTSIVLGGTGPRVMVIGAVTVNIAEALKLWSAVASAVTVTVAPTILGIWSGPGTMKFVGTPGGE